MKYKKIITLIILGVIMCNFIIRTNTKEKINTAKVYQESNKKTEYNNKSFDIIWLTNNAETKKTVVHYYDITNNKEIDGSTNWTIKIAEGQKVNLKNRRGLTAENELKYNYIGAKINNPSGENTEEISYLESDNSWYYYPISTGERKLWNNNNTSTVHVYLLYEEKIQTNNLEKIQTENTSSKINIMAYDYSFVYNNGFTGGINNTDNNVRPFLIAGKGDASEWYNKWSGYWSKEMINSHTTSYDGNNKEFIAQNIIDKTLKDGSPTLSKETDNKGVSLSYLFDETNVDGKIVYGGNNTSETLNYLFNKDKDGYYSYDSEKNFASLASTNSNQKDFVVYKTPSSSKNKGKFMPFNDINKNKELIGKGAHGNDEDYNQYYSGYTEGIGNGNFAFGMKIEFDFLQTKDGKDLNENDTILEIGADDSLWVFIDDVLILDLGGVHGKATTSINFATGEIKEANLISTIAEKIRAASANVELNSNGLFGDGTKHHVKIYWLERGGYESIFNIKFNLELVDHSLYNIVTETDGNGKIITSQELAEKEDTIELAIQPKETYVLDTLKVTDDQGNNIEIKDNKFIMPASNVKIEATFQKTEEEQIPNPDTNANTKLLELTFIFLVTSTYFISKNYKKTKY